MRNRNRMAPSLVGLLALALWLAATPSALAQGVTTTGQIRGQVTDESGQPVATASVIAVNTQTGLQRGALTGGDGVYAIRLLPPGTYTVRAELIGRTPDEATVQVVIGNASTVNLQLATQAVELEGIEVTAGGEVVDATEAGVKDLVSLEEIEELPALGRDFTDFINLSGLVAPDPGATTGGQFSIAGMRASQTNIQIDGVDANNAFFGENRGGSRIPFAFSLESIREFQIITNGYDVEFGNYSGGIVNVVTRGGTNEFDGTAYVNYRSDALTGSNFGVEGEDPTPVADYQVTQYAARISGPIKEDKAFFLLSLDGQRRREPQLPLTQGRFAPGGVNESEALFGEVGRFFDILEQQYGIQNPEAGYQSFQTTNDVITLFGRVDWNINNDHRLSVRHNYSNYTNDNEWNDNFDFIYGRSRAEEFEDISNSFVAELQSVFSPTRFNVLRFQFADEQRPRNGKELRPALIVNLSEGQRIGYGGTFASFQNDLAERKLQLIDNFTQVVGDHTLKVGVNGIFTNVKNQFILEGAGEYTFPSLEAFAAYRPSSFERNVLAGGGIPFSDFNVTEWAVYAQDEWQATPKLTATLGVRYDVQRFEDSPGRVIEAERAFGLTTGVAPVDNDNISPRLALAYDLFGDGRAVLRGGLGYFYGRVPYVLGGNVQSTVRPVLSLACTGSIAEGDPNAPPSPEAYPQWTPAGDDNPISCAGGSSLSGVPEYAFWNPNFEFPETFKANVGYEQLLGSQTRVSMDLLFSQSHNLYTVRNLNLRDAQFQLASEGGRRIFQPEGVFDPTADDPAANTLRSRRNLEFDDIFVNYNDGFARAYSATMELSHNFSENTGFSGSYTFTRSYDNSSYSCCTASSGFEDPSVGLYGPNDLGGVGDFERAWGVSDFSRDHTFIFSGQTVLPLDVEVSAIWRVQSGRPWTPEVSGDLNGDGVRFNDRPFIFQPENLPLAATGAEAEEERARYAELLAENSCVGDYAGQIVDRNTCRFPWFNQLDLRLSRGFDTTNGQRAELQLDLFNVLNGLNDDWGRYVGVFGANRNILLVEGYDADTDQILYSVPDSFAREEALGSNLLLQFQAQLGLRYYF